MRTIFDSPNVPDKIRYISHRGFQPLAPANSIPAFEYAGWLGQWAIETDVHFTRDGIAVCCHDDCVDTCFNGSGKIRELTWAEISRFQYQKGERLACLLDAENHMPTFAEYLAICKRWGSIPFIELKTDDVGRVMEAVEKAGLEEEGIVLSTVNLERLLEVRKYSSRTFIHWIFGNEKRIDELAGAGFAGMSWKIDDPLARPCKLIDLSHKAGLKVCLRAADSVESVRCMMELGLDYLPTNCMHNPFEIGRKAL